MKNLLMTPLDVGIYLFGGGVITFLIAVIMYLVYVIGAKC